jgi:hypothetical protein
MATDTEILMRLRDLVAGTTSLEVFENWFVEETWDDQPDQVSALAAGVMAVLAESAGSLDRRMATAQLALLLPAVEVVWSSFPSVVQEIDAAGWFAPPGRRELSGTTVTTAGGLRPVPA